MCSVHWDQKASDSLEWELRMFVIYHVDAGNQTMTPGEAANALSLGGSSLAPLGINLTGEWATSVESPETRLTGNSSWCKLSVEKAVPHA